MTQTGSSTKKSYKLIDSSMHPKGQMPWIILHLWGFLCIRDLACRGNKITAYFTGVFVTFYVSVHYMGAPL